MHDLNLVYLLVARAHHRLDELSRCIEAALWGNERTEVWLIMLSADDKEYSFMKIGDEFVEKLGSAPSEMSILNELAELQKGTVTYANLEECLEGSCRVFTCRETDVLVVLHEDAPMLVPQDNGDVKRAMGWERSIWLFGAHEDFLKQVAKVSEFFSTMCGDMTRVSLGPVALHSSACIHSVNAFLQLPAPAHPNAVYQALTTAASSDVMRLKPTLDLESMVRCVPNRGSVHYWVRLDTESVESKVCQLAAVATIWASKSAYREKDTKLTFVFPNNTALTLTRALLDLMPRHELEGKAPNESNVFTALVAAHANDVRPDWKEEFAAQTSRLNEVLVLTINDEAPCFPDDPAVPCTTPHPRDLSLQVLINLPCPELDQVQVTSLTASLRGTPTAKLPRMLVALQGLHSLGRLKPLVRKYGEQDFEDIPEEEIMGVDEVRAAWAKLGYCDQERIGRDTRINDELVAIRGNVTAVRSQGNVAFIGLQSKTGNRVQVVLPVGEWGPRSRAAVKKMNCGDVMTVSGYPGHTSKGRLSLMGERLAKVEMAPPSVDGVVFLAETEDVVVYCKPSRMVTHLTSTTRAADRPSAACEVARQRNVRRVHFVHSVEKDTSGVVVYCKEGAKVHDMEKEMRDAEKVYLVVAGWLEGEEKVFKAGDEWVSNEPLKEAIRDGASSKRQATRVEREAKTSFRVIQAIPEARAVILAATPHTHCTRQIRKHLATRSLYVVGDQLQGNSKLNRTFNLTYAFSSTALHLWRVTVGSNIFTAPIPVKLVLLIQSMPGDATAVFEYW
eukprot:TRINITY_DN37388_c0_g1_i1.p1 TRINITY_DN37388_c0_g1~~TRINITY_DN37388_c0_g1_i1.p1  ORF type:complete len:787 (+),score=150.53 TRINITY_DN37388_c0_g1_i1:35-2395(+)